MALSMKALAAIKFEVATSGWFQQGAMGMAQSTASNNRHSSSVVIRPGSKRLGVLPWPQTNGPHEQRQGKQPGTDGGIGGTVGKRRVKEGQFHRA